MNLIKDLKRSLQRVEGAVRTWNTDLLHNMAKLREDGVATDVTVVVVDDNGHTSFPAHSLVLAATSPSLAAILASSGDNSESFTLILPGEDRAEVERAIRDSYLGERDLGRFLGRQQKEKLQRESVKEEAPLQDDEGGNEDLDIEDDDDNGGETQSEEQDEKHTGGTWSVKGEEYEEGECDDFDDEDWFEEENQKKKNHSSPKKGGTIPCQESGCNKMFVNNHTHLYHLKKFHNINKYDQERFIDDKVVKLLPSGRFQCPDCDNDFSDKNSLKYHIKSQHENKKSTCHICGKTMAPSKERLKRHIERVHSAGPSFFCDQCDYSTTVKRALKNHIDSQHDPTRHTCKDCGKTFGHKVTLAHHIDDKHLGKSWVCEKCGFPAKSRAQLYKHKIEKHAPANFVCSFCDFVSSSNTDLEDHKRSVHQGEVVKMSPQKNNERRRKEREAQMDLTCHICHVKKNSRQMLQLHIQADHHGIRYNCTEEGCSFSAKQKTQLRTHINIKHLGIKVNCEICDYKTAQVTCLNNHMLKKHGIKPFSCDKCSFRCFKKEKMQSHMQSMHSP